MPTSIKLADSTPDQLTGAGVRDGREQELESLRRSLQEQRRATTLLNAELQTQIEAREAVEVQIIEANAEIAASWDRRKEMTRVIADRDAKLAEAQSELQTTREQLAQSQSELQTAREQLAESKSELETARAQLGQIGRDLAEAREEAKTNRERRKEIARVVANRDAKIERIIAARDAKMAKVKGELTAELHARYAEMAALQRHIARNSLSGRAKRLVRPLTRLFR